MEPLQILLADDEEIVCRTLGDYMRDLGHRVDEVRDGLAALQAAETREFSLAIIDVRMPGLDGLSLLARLQEIRPAMPVVIITAHGNMETVIQALRHGATDFLAKPVKLLELDAVLEKCLRMGRLQQERINLRETIGDLQEVEQRRIGSRGIVGASAATEQVRNQIRQAVEARCDTILITGETGTGKEVVAREIHFQAMPKSSPFIAVNCPALSESLLESELFGHTKGAFTGASENRCGCFELANGGTLFLDEIGDLPGSAQVKLLRVLETRTVRRVGGSKDIRLDIRVIAATNAPIETLIKSGGFRPDLYYRLNVFAIQLVPLRARRDDILPLARRLLSNYTESRGLKIDGFAEEAQSLLMKYDFPGNVRELRNLIERAAILCRSGTIGPEHLPVQPAPQASAAAPVAAAPQPGSSMERDRILKALEECRWNRRQAAAKLGMPYSTLRYKMREFQLS